MNRIHPRLAFALAGLLATSPAWGDSGSSDEGPPSEAFEKYVRPLLAERCYSCHSASAKALKGGLRLDTREGLARGGDGGPVVVPGDPDSSPLIEAVRETDPLLRMPPDAPLSPREIDTLVDWVRSGAPDPREAAPSGAPSSVATSRPAADWWSLRPVREHRPPPVSDQEWPRSDLDRFVLAKLEAAGLGPAPGADRPTLIRRLSFDLTGLPPTPEEVESFVGDAAPDAYEKVVDRLLASPHHGERWGRHWLDVVRYADTSGCNGDFPIPEAYRYRNYVIDSLNRDKPYDEFVREQIAGDLMPHRSEGERRERLIATGYLAISRRFSSVAEEFHLTLDDTIDNVGKAFLGLSVSCARCHDHKFDPIPQKDYYALYGIFESTRYAFPGTEIYRHQRDMVPLVPADRLEGELKPFLDEMAGIDAEILDVYGKIEKADTGKLKDGLRARWESLKSRRDALLKALPDFEEAYGATEGTPADTRLQLKGEPTKLGDPVPRGFLKALGGKLVPPDEPGSGRRQLADWLTDPANPLTARVLVNRVWGHHFGHGLVRSVNDFGTRGDLPTHPELLDELARRFVASGWSLKTLHREMVLSATYRMASVENPRAAGIDPENLLLWSFPRRRLGAEELRDALLLVSGGLDRSPGGGHPFPPEVTWRYSQHKPFVDDYPSARRGVYLMQQRFRLQPFLATFDGADTNASTGARQASTTPQQALFSLNSAFVEEQASRLATTLLDTYDRHAPRVDRAYRLAFGRGPSPEELAEALDFLTMIQGPLAAAGVPERERPRAALVSYLRALLGSNEFIFVD